MIGRPSGCSANSSEESPGWSLRAPPGALGRDRADQVGSGVLVNDVDICPIGTFHTTQQNFLITCSEPRLGMAPEDEEMMARVPALLSLAVWCGGT